MTLGQGRIEADRAARMRLGILGMLERKMRRRDIGMKRGGRRRDQNRLAEQAYGKGSVARLQGLMPQPVEVVRVVGTFSQTSLQNGLKGEIIKPVAGRHLVRYY